jgi:phage gpG-like protein
MAGRPRPFISRRAAGGAVLGPSGSHRPLTGIPFGGLAILRPFDPDFQAATYIYAGDVDKLGAQFRSWKEPLMRSLVEVIIPSIKMNFAAQGRPDAWQRLAKSTVVSRMRKGFSRGPILVRTGLLRRVATSHQVWQVEPMFKGPGSDALNFRIYYFNAKVPYGRHNQIGTMKLNDPQKGFSVLRTSIIGNVKDPTADPFFSETKGINLFPSGKWRSPARPFIMLQNDDEIEIYNLFIEYLYEKANKFWGMRPDYRGH